MCYTFHDRLSFRYDLFGTKSITWKFHFFWYKTGKDDD